MTNYMEDAFAPVYAYNQAMIFANTWGYPRPRIKYSVRFLIVRDELGITTTAIRSEFPDDCGNPFFWDDFQDWSLDLELENGGVYIFDGYYMKYKNGGFRFTGKLRKITINEW